MSLLADNDQSAVNPPTYKTLLARYGWLLALLAIFALAAFLRFYNLRTNPGWYTDEGTDLDIARNLLAGEVRYFALKDSTMLVARPLTMHLILAGLFLLFGSTDILVLRILAVSCNLLTLLVMGIWGRRIWGTWLALLSALMFAIFPNAVLYGRMGFSYNLLQPLFLIFVFALWEFGQTQKTRWLALAAVGTALGLSINLLALAPIAFMILYLLLRAPRHILWTLPLSLSLFGIHTVVMLSRAPEAYLFDLSFTNSRFSAGLPLQIVQLTWYYKELLNLNFWFPLGLVGHFLIRDVAKRRFFTYYLLFSLFFVVRSTPVTGQGFYLLLPWLPLISLGLALFLMEAFRFSFAMFKTDFEALWEHFESRWLKRSGYEPVWRPRVKAISVSLLLIFIVLAPLLAVLAEDFFSVHWILLNQPDGVTRSVEGTETLIAFLNQRLAHDDVVLASPQIGWALHARVADFQQAVAYTGGNTIHFPSNIPQSRFLYDISLDNADYVVIDDHWRNWAAENIEAVKGMIETVQTWPVIYEAGEFQVYENPEKL
jgi:4-amino-4-deoxy-L-arabinose transferase-like glycosyltransferase